MEELEKETSKPGQFFAADLSIIEEMVEVGAGAEEVMAYLILARGVNHRNGLRISTHGAQSIAKRAGMTYRRARKALEFLKAAGYIRSAEEYPEVPRHLGKGAGIEHRARWVLHVAGDQEDSDTNIYLANSIADGTGTKKRKKFPPVAERTHGCNQSPNFEKNPQESQKGQKKTPLMRIYKESKYRPAQLYKNTKLDALMVLLQMYRCQDMAECGGIDPRLGVYTEWVATEDSECKTMTDFSGTNYEMHEIQRRRWRAHNEFGMRALAYVEETERRERFLDAFNNIVRLGFVYEVIQVWSGNPNGSDGNNAELMYTLYIDDYHAQKTEPYLQKEIHSAAFRAGAMDAPTEFAFKDRNLSEKDTPLDGNIVCTGRFRYIAIQGSTAYPIGVYRLRFRPGTSDVGLGIEMEQRRVQQWTDDLRCIDRQNHSNE